METGRHGEQETWAHGYMETGGRGEKMGRGGEKGEGGEKEGGTMSGPQGTTLVTYCGLAVLQSTVHLLGRWRQKKKKRCWYVHVAYLHSGQLR